jgi:ureidoglycolate hydrolase
MEENIKINDKAYSFDQYGSIVEMDLKKIREENQNKTSEYMKSFIYGGMDGIISVFVALGVASLTNLANPKIILVLAFAKLISGR